MYLQQVSFEGRLSGLLEQTQTRHLFGGEGLNLRPPSRDVDVIGVLLAGEAADWALALIGLDEEKRRGRRGKTDTVRMSIRNGVAPMRDSTQGKRREALLQSLANLAQTGQAVKCSKI